ncbi:peptidylprolyl isomerase [Clostridium kluyveri]|uniref:Peptidylprolyl isomerase n=1 Tax=Clostridium kluyveri TaxID=1534 RepID=A0A1L5FDP0_CLOKL|nr:peptidylprolyl isomerase [Clostridium kluyveri]APM41097.1 peptidylprolyl isomerase [Clostridium kluyveri]UZQ48622.1 peptidylprolyl isomerase [Clostridium kluyveri]
MQNNVLAIVNNVEITENDFQNIIKRFPAERQQYFNTDEGKKQLLDEIISFELFYNYGKEIELEKDKDYLIKLEMTKKELLIQETISKVMENIKVTDKEVEDYYTNNKSMYKKPENVTARHILVDSFEKAAQISNEIEKGLSFEDAAKKYSSCPSKAQGGNLGNFTRGQMVPEFETAAFQLEIDTLSKPVKTQFGYHLIKVEKKEKDSIKGFDEVKNAIKNGLLQEKRTLEYSKCINNLKDKYPIQIK